MGHMANIYYSAKKYCREGEILMIVDGDDELVGQHVLHLFNAHYHRTKALSVYSNHIRAIRNADFYVGTSQAYQE